LPKMTTPVEQTEMTPETQTETPDDLRASLDKTSDAFEAITTQIADLQSQIRSRHERLDELEVLTLESSRLAAHLREQVDQAEEKLSRARIAAGIAKGGRSEKATAANVKTLTADLAALQQEFTDAHQANSKQTAEAKIESDSINKQLEDDQKTLEALQQTRSELKAEKQERKKALGQAIYAVLADEMRGLLEDERKREEALAEQRALRLARQESIAERLADWPQLASQLVEQLTPLDEKRAPEPSPSVRLTKLFMKYLKLYAECGPQLEIPQQSTPTQVFQLFLFPDQLAQLLASPQRHVHLEQRLEALRTYLWQVEQQERDRALYRELGLYGRQR
jgi:uncharacterized phage infection (PIP) family protein YhgE